ncbi:WG repeat-containing protein, partial [Campylobacter coli]|nr:WG repeat-containing protein [Campylobacter coli]EIX2499103.1 WG repeat-containing protein [Campylobacter coli]EJE3565144.1 WG repeat-containing protein [Campylobacter coli]EJZ2949260.1 WG repeat-containing protein [Campylobacter coli]EKB6486783.1 WG repeat-containing protein [Campylobacter coli]
KLNGKYGFIDKNGEFAIEPKFDYVWSFWEGLAGVKLNGKWGFIDKSGKIVIEPIFDDIDY